MMRIRATGSDFLKKDFLAVLIIVVNAFSWYFPLYVFFLNTLEKNQVGFSILLDALGIHFMGVTGFAFIGTILVKKFPSRSAFLCLWMFTGAISSALLFTLDVNNIVSLLSVSFLLGTSLGLGFPSCLAYFGDYSIEENRGRVGGITFFVSALGMLLVGFLVNMSTFVVGVLILTLWRSLGLILFLLIKPKQEHGQGMVEVSYRLAITDKSLVLYLVPWIMFCLVNFFEFPIVTNFFGSDFTLLILIAEYGIGGFSALIGGHFADSVGRSPIIIMDIRFGAIRK